MWSLWRNKARKEANNSAKKAEEALNDAHRNLREVKKRGEEVTQVSNALKHLRQRNHFAEALEAIIVQREGPRT